MILITSILTVASVYEHFTNICIGLLLILMMFFIVFSITMIKTSLMRNNATQHAGMNDSIWTTVADIGNIGVRAHLDEQFLRDPPSYDSVIQDSKYFFPSPPPYSAVACPATLPKYTEARTLCKSTNGTYIRSADHIIINVSKLSDSSTPST
ncbi:hypothetical protein V9T40_003974 [Parthenolecanium corni]|uniref:Uncharacterized protein n=1 Tax=Parthenolecanium corni TaxID=536013 RepID=A0AAN9Y2R2_9HEMI